MGDCCNCHSEVSRDGSGQLSRFLKALDPAYARIDDRSINDGFFVPDPDGEIWYDFPAISATRHNYSYGLNFADGHSELWKLRDPKSRLVDQNRVSQPGNTDLKRLGEASSVRR